MELAPDAQETLRKAAAGTLDFKGDPKLQPEKLRSAVRSATEILDRALGTAPNRRLRPATQLVHPAPQDRRVRVNRGPGPARSS